ncbi:MAG: hypothetical protein CL735_02495 [Chloroflexi bacterium]|nr:hypothetical protein [Chloroflexota bacterium]|tara:strand:+ start:933 stop:1703 length:771 start_codon:yes stop_codon:yes gene_type:complete
MSHQKQWFNNFFGSDYLKIYSGNFDSKRTIAEVNFIIETLRLKPKSKILDLCCGQGRHSIELSIKGMNVVSQDLIQEYLDIAEEEAKAKKVNISTICSDMSTIPFESEFDAIINMFTAFGYLNSKNDDFQVLKEMYKSLKPGGKLLIDTLNREWVIINNIEREWRQDKDGTLIIEERNFDLETSRNHVSFKLVSPEGKIKEIEGHKIRLYTLTELIQMLENANFVFKKAFGYYNSSNYDKHSRRMIILAEKPLVKN